MPSPAALPKPTRGPSPGWGELRRDRVHGAYPLAHRALEKLERAFGGRSTVTGSELRRWARRVEVAQPTMGPLIRLAEELRRVPRGRGSVPTGELLRWAERSRGRLTREEAGVARTSARALRSFRSVLTLSDSSAVRRALLDRTGGRSPIRVTELRSRPGREALRFARELRRSGIPVRVVPDARAALEVTKVELVIVGADLIFSDGSVLHKIGTRHLAQLAHAAGVPFCVLAGGSKQLGRRPPSRLPRPRLYDRTPARWITEYWSDSGIRSAGGPNRRHPKARRGTR